MAGVKGSGCGLKPGQKALVGAGRKKGTPNGDRNEIQQLIAEACPGWNPLQAMAKAAQIGYFDIYDPATGEPAVDPNTGAPIRHLIQEKTRATLLKEVNEYCYAKRKAVDISTPPGEEITIRTNNDTRAEESLTQMIAQLGAAV